MSEHVTPAKVRELTRGCLRPDEILAVARHLEHCAACQSLAQGEEHPDLERTLFPYVNGTLPAAARRDVDAHLATCARCREDVADARAERLALRRRRASRTILPALAAAAAIGFVLFFLRTPSPPPPQPEPRPHVITTTRPSPLPSKPFDYGRPAWNTVVAEALAQRRIALPPEVAELRHSYDVLRGSTVADFTQTFTPVGTAVESQRPELRWPDAGESYVVTIFANDAIVATSDVLRTNRWTPRQPLARGETYVWQVDVRTGSRTTMMPAPPQPQALFRVLDANAAAELEQARRVFPNDHLLLGVLYARYGVVERAREHLAAYAAAHPESEAAQQLAASVSG